MTLAARDQEFRFTASDYRQVADLIHRYAGIALADSKQHLVYGRLSRRLRVLRIRSFKQYLQIVADNAVEREEFCNALTTNLTAFFRENHHFEYLSKTVFPELQRRNAQSKRIRIWSAGCSSGEEPYSLAITAREFFGAQSPWDVRILATDIDSKMVAQGSRGVYPADRFEKMPASRRERWFVDDGTDAYVANAELKSLIAFRQLNLMHAWPFKGPFDVIFCRNVVIYFTKDTQIALFEKIAAKQQPGDHLFLGHSESLFNICNAYSLISKTIYRRRD